MEHYELSFVSVCGNTEEDVRTTNKAVRAHVMRRYKQQQRISKWKRHEKDTRLAADKTMSPKPYAIQRRPASVLKLTTCLDGELDPFHSLPVRLSRRELMLLHHNASSAIRTSVHADSFDVYRKTCSKDPAWLFMNLFYASNRFAEVLNLQPTECMGYLLQSISALNQSIARYPDTVDDSTIATVACLANIENLNGITSHAAIHMHGLQRMVELRGGLECLGMRGILRRLVLWSDLLHSSSCERAPQFSFHTGRDMTHLSNFIPSTSHVNFHAQTYPDLDDITTTKTKIGAAQILSSLYGLSIFLNITGTQKLPWEVAWPDRVYDVEYRIVTSLYNDTIMASTDVKTKLGVLILHAALLFIYSNLRETPVGGGIREKLIYRLYQAAKVADIEKIGAPFPAEALWVALVGTTSAATGEHQRYFSDILRQMCSRLNIWTILDMQTFLMGFPVLRKDRWQLLRDSPF